MDNDEFVTFMFERNLKLFNFWHIVTLLADVKRFTLLSK